MEEALALYLSTRQRMKAYNYMMMIMSWDGDDAPSGSFAMRDQYQEIISADMYEMDSNPAFIDVISVLWEHKDELDEVLRHEIIEIKKRNDNQRKIPKAEFVRYAALTSSSGQVWAKAKKNNDFALFEPVLEEIVEYQKKYVKWLESDQLKGYDILLDAHEMGFTTKEYDEFFALLKAKLVPFVNKVTSLKYAYNDDFAHQKYDVKKQKEIAKYIEDVMCFDHERGIGKESEHPYTSGDGSFDVRYTNHFYEDNFTSSLYSAIHELGHATYEQQSDPKLDSTFVSGGASMAMHESQSRFYENMIGRSESFIRAHFNKFKAVFHDELNHVSFEDFFHYINKVENSLIRTEADELTYSLHIMLRYDLEKALVSGELAVKDLPMAWNAKMKEYLGVDVPSDTEGVLQDVHWTSGLMGYFPTYALGSAYAAQIYHAMSKEIDIDKAIMSGTNKEINAWLKEKIHKYGASKYPKELMMQATGEKFNPNYYIDYLIEKYSKIYDIKD